MVRNTVKVLYFPEKKILTGYCIINQRFYDIDGNNLIYQIPAYILRIFLN